MAGGFLLAFGTGFVVNKLAYSILGSKKLPALFTGMLSWVIPLGGLLIVMWVPFIVAMTIYGIHN